MNKRLFVTMAVVIPIAFGTLVIAQGGRAAQIALQHFTANARAYGLTNPSNELRERKERTDELGVTHVRFNQVYRGLPVFEGEAIAHVDASDNVTVTNAIAGNLNLNTTPRIGRAAAVNTAVRFISPVGDYEVRDASLWILPRGQRSIVDRLVWHVSVAVENDFEDPAEWQYFIDAQSGDVAFSYNGLETSNATGTANTMYSGSGKAINIDLQGSTYYLRDIFRASSTSSPYGNTTCDMRGGRANCYYITSAGTVFGNGAISTTGVTAAADAHYGLQQTWDFYKSSFGRNGIDGKGKITISRVHYGKKYENAFWSDSCFCMTYGDGATTFYPLVSLDVAGHEMSHGVMSTEANLTYSGESGGLNESNSDIFGTMVEFFTNSANDVPEYWIGEKIYKANYPNGATGDYVETKALRYMDDPHKDGTSPACWSDSIGSLNVHYSSGPGNHMFYLLSHGGVSKCDDTTNVAGLGNTRASAIWYKAISDYMTSGTDYHGARTAALAAAAQLYPGPGPQNTGSTEYNTVAAAFSAINVN